MLKHILHTSFEKNIIERAMEYVKDRTEAFDDYYPCRKKAVDCNNLAHVYKWLILFVFLYNLSKSQCKINIMKFLRPSLKILLWIVFVWFEIENPFLGFDVY